MAQLAAGTMLAGYRIERFLAQGGMGVVYLASQMSLDRPIALKLIAPERPATTSSASASCASRGSRRRSTIRTSSPSTRRARRTACLYVAMRYVDGPDLGALLRAAGALEPERAARDHRAGRAPRSTPRTPAGSSIATSSPATCSSRIRAGPSTAT